MLLWVKSIYSQNCSFELVKSYFLKWFQSISSLQDSRGWDDSSSEVWESLHHRGAFAISNWGHHLADLWMYQLSFQSARHPSRTHVFLDQSIIFSWWNRHFSCSNHHEITMKSPWNHHEITRFPRVFLCFSVKYHHFPMGFLWFSYDFTIFLWVSWCFLWFPGPKPLDFPRPTTDDVDPKALRRTVSAAPAEPSGADAASPGGPRVPRGMTGGWAGRNGETTGKP
jgi:hypothetical protein